MLKALRRAAGNHHAEQYMNHRSSLHTNGLFTKCRAIVCKDAAAVIAKYEDFTPQIKQPGPFPKRSLRKVNTGLEAYIDGTH